MLSSVQWFSGAVSSEIAHFRSICGAASHLWVQNLLQPRK